MCLHESDSRLVIYLFIYFPFEEYRGISKRSSITIPSYDLPEEEVSVQDIRNHFFAFVPLAVRFCLSFFSLPSFLFLISFLVADAHPTSCLRSYMIAPTGGLSFLVKHRPTPREIHCATRD